MNFTEPVNLLRQSVVKDSFSQPIETFAQVRTLFCEKTEGAIGETISDKVVNYAENYDLNTWYMSDITSKDRLEIGGEQFNIISLVPVDNRTYLKIKVVKIYD